MRFAWGTHHTCAARMGTSTCSTSTVGLVSLSLKPNTAPLNSVFEPVPHERCGRGSEAWAADVPCMMLCTCRLARISLLSRLGGLPELALSGLITLGQAGSSPRHPIVAHCVMYKVLRGVAVARERDGQRNTFAKWGVGCGRLLLAVCGVQVA